MNVTASIVTDRLERGLSPELENDDQLRALALELGREITEYGVSALPREVFKGRSGAEIAAMVCEDLEAALWMRPLLAMNEVEVPAPPVPEPAEGEEPAAPQGPTIELVPPRIVDFSSGWGMTALLLSILNPDQPFELVEPRIQRMWWWRRLKSLHGTRNLRIHQQSHEEFARSNRRNCDVVILKRMAPTAALDFGIELVNPRGRILSFQRGDRSAEVRTPRVDPDGRQVRLDDCIEFKSPAARQRTLICSGAVAEELDAAAAPA